MRHVYYVRATIPSNQTNKRGQKSDTDVFDFRHKQTEPFGISNYGHAFLPRTIGIT